jgi:preprotein translocase subunit YajC
MVESRVIVHRPGASPARGQAKRNPQPRPTSTLAGALAAEPSFRRRLLPVLIPNAFAQTPSAAPGADMLTGFLPMILIFVVFYFLLIRPQQRKAKEHRTMLAALQKGDEVVTAGGVVGRVSKLTDQYATIEIAPSVEINVQRSAIGQLLPKGTIKTL